jgi:hypothetical protein
MTKGDSSVFDRLPYDILNIINKKVKDDYVVSRRIQRKKNRAINRYEHQQKTYKLLCENIKVILPRNELKKCNTEDDINDFIKKTRLQKYRQPDYYGHYYPYNCVFRIGFKFKIGAKNVFLFIRKKERPDKKVFYMDVEKNEWP